jgi:hypothetical protein
MALYAADMELDRKDSAHQIEVLQAESEVFASV